MYELCNYQNVFRAWLSFVEFVVRNHDVSLQSFFVVTTYHFACSRLAWSCIQTFICLFTENWYRCSFLYFLCCFFLQKLNLNKSFGYRSGEQWSFSHALIKYYIKTSNNASLFDLINKTGSQTKPVEAVSI